MGNEAIVIGGSIAGLMCGIMLKHHGYTVKILEQDVSNSREGHNAGIGLSGEVGAFLKVHDRVGREMMIEGPPGNNKALPQWGTNFLSTSWGLLCRVLRANFDGLTSKAVPNAPHSHEGDGAAVFKNGARVTDMREVLEKVQVQYENVADGMIKSLSAEVVVVADGSTSSMRRTLLPEADRRYLGYMCWRGVVPEELVEKKWNKFYSQRATIEFMDQSYIIIYTIPTDDGDFCTGKSLHNWLWYSRLARAHER
ncbi:hypothetical protein K458DRAFT_409074 [Lentithecium fluviatile CBS 122367]|uniref:2,6-dihydroxypyridine 3-monooxygenase substrate binding domain-containing protein n=1 Tax=Lentithecium fluviatile CBS 122367 TaxID=1168545 RepID=A0A6G1IJC4_9PLEO|nr:hypothetical protein K458DRAFT_409074 [Lentithecium fluviatile CBS 122367]